MGQNLQATKQLVGELEKTGLNTHEAWQVFSLLIGARDVFLLDGANRNPQDQMRIQKSLERFLPEPQYFVYPYYHEQSQDLLYVLYTTQQIPPEIVKTFGSDQDAIAPYMDYPCWGDIGGGGGFRMAIYTTWDGKQVGLWESGCATLTDERKAEFARLADRFKKKFREYGLETESEISIPLEETDVGNFILDALDRGKWDELLAKMPQLYPVFKSWPYEKLWNKDNDTKLEGTLDTTNASTLKKSMSRNEALWYSLALDFYHNVMPAMPWSQSELLYFERKSRKRIKKFLK